MWTRLHPLTTASSRRVVLGTTAVLGIAFAVGSALLVQRIEAERSDDVIERHRAIVDARLSSVTDDAVATLQAIRPLWALRDDPSRVDFSDYLDSGIAETGTDGSVLFGGLSTVAFVRHVAPGEASDFLARRRAESAGTGWYEDDLADAVPHYVVDYHSSDDIVGVDLYPLENRRSALEAARDTAGPVATSWFDTVADADKPLDQRRRVVVVVVPVYEDGEVPQSVSGRREHLVGWLASALFAEDVVERLRRDLSIDVALYEGTGPARTLVATSTSGRPAQPDVTMVAEPLGRRWTVELALSPSALSAPLIGPWWVLVGGLLLTTLVTIILWLMARVGDNALRRADDATTLLQQSDESLHFVAEQVPVGICDMDADGRVRWMNGRARALMDDGAAGQDADIDVMALVHPDDHEAVASALAAAAETCTTFTVRHRVPAADEPRWAELTGAPIASGDGRCGRMMVVVTDMTAVVEHESGLIDARDQALEASQLKSQFLANMSHEIRTPLNGVIGMADVLFAGDLTSEQRAKVATLRTAAIQLKDLLDDILDLSKIEAGKVTVETVGFHLPNTVASAVRLHASEAFNRGLKLRLDLDPALPALVRGPKLRLRQVLNNLVGNAVKFTSEGRVTVSADVVRRAGDEALVRFTVADTGRGIPRAELANVFQPFTQVDGSASREFGGTGLGLAISRQLVELMDGTLTAESVEGEGSTFRFAIPLDVKRWDGDGVADPDDAASGATNPPPADGYRGRLLVVEDNPINREVARELLKALGYAVDLATGGAEGVDASAAVPYDAVLMDCQMPGMDGYEATRQIRAREQRDGGHTPIIAMTASAMQGDRERCLAVGMDDYLSKPISSGQLEAALRRWTGEERRDGPPVAPTGSTAGTADALVDWERLHQLSAVPDLLARSLALFRERGNEEIATLGALVANGDHGNAAALAHKVKGAAATVGAAQLAHQLAQLEHACRAGDADVAERTVVVTQAVFLESLEALATAESHLTETAPLSR